LIIRLVTTEVVAIENPGASHLKTFIYIFGVTYFVPAAKATENEVRDLLRM